MLVSGEGSNLQALLDSVEHRSDIRIVAVASNRPGVRALERAEAAAVETRVFESSEYDNRAARDEALAAWLEEKRADLVVLAGFMEILSSGFVRRFHQRIINVHPSLLPAFPGVRAIEQALAYGVRVMGVTVHFVDEGVDSGPIILQESFDPVPYARDRAALEHRIHEIEHRLLPRAVRLIAAGAVRVDPGEPRLVTIEEGADGGD